MQPTRAEIVEKLRAINGPLRSGRFELLMGICLESLIDRIKREGIAPEPPELVTGDPASSPSREEIYWTIRSYTDGPHFLSLDSLRDLARRIEANGIAPAPCRGESCPGCPECAVTVAEAVKGGIPAGTAVHIRASRQDSTFILNAVINLQQHHRMQMCHALPPLGELLEGIARGPGSMDYALDVPSFENPVF